MVLSPRFRRVAALQREFVDREPVLAAFADELTRIGDGPRIFNVTGVGGIGKSRLLRELSDRAAAAGGAGGGGHRTAALDLQVPALRQAEDALAVLRKDLGAKGIRFDRFDIAYAVLWQRLHPHLRVSRETLAFLDDSSIVTDILDSMSGLPVFGTARGLVKALGHGSSDLRRRLRIRGDSTLNGLDDLPNAELVDAVTYLFAEDLRESAASRPYVLVFDSYEALVPTPVRGGRAQLADEWLRDLVGQLDRGLTVIASREPLRWDLHDAEWEPLITVQHVEGLPMRARLDLLDAGGISDAAQRRTIAEASAGLPFYLNLAVDTYEQTGGRVSGPLVDQQEILVRFLRNVAPDEIRSLEILSPARIFDYDVFVLLANSFHLPAHRLAWESLTAYSFIYPAQSAFRLHQLMRAAVGERLSAAAARDIHLLLRDLWDGRAGTEDGARAVREAAYHALHSGEATGADLLRYADLAVRRGGHGAAGGISDDLAAYLSSRAAAGEPDETVLADTVRADTLTCLRAEAAVRLGDAATAVELTPVANASEVTTVVGARLAVAAGHGRRIAGDTAAALAIYTHAWVHAAGGPRLTAGLWAADLHMSQGRFRDAETLAVALEALAPPEDAELLGDIARLRHLAHRFAFDFPAAAHHLDLAEAHYRRADSVLDLANIATNRAELNALTGAASAQADAAAAIEIQRDIGALHELGKTYTALALAHLRAGRLAEADTALRAAFTALDQAGYRSGRARAEFYQGLVQARRGRIDEAVETLRHTVAELEAAEVYPTVVIAAAHAATVLGVDDPELTAAARRAETAIQPFDETGTGPGGVDEISRRVRAFTGGLLDGAVTEPARLYREAAGRADTASGFYHHNVRAHTPHGDVIVRIPIAGSDTMDLTIWPEDAILRALRGQITHAPRLLYASARPAFDIHEFIPGVLLDDLAPRGSAVPPHVIGDVVDLFGRLGAIPAGRVPPQPPDWPADGNTTDFARRLSAVTATVHRRFQPEFGGLFAALGIPDDPLGAIERSWTTLHPRPFRLLHTDVHRKNLIVNDGETYFLDWELALWGDPVYDLAVHLHKMAYQPDELTALLAGWTETVTGPAAAHWREDLDTYLAHERVKSAIVDTVRYTKLLTQPGPNPDDHADLIDKLTAKLAAAHTGGAGWPSRTPPDRATVIAAIGAWAELQPE
jgi:tetratricopeptide (TPR) repeat protein